MSKNVHNFDYDYFVIGAGSGGVRSARIASTHGAKVGIAEELFFGGTCVNVGCVPKKLLSYASHFSDDFEDAKGFGWDVPAPSFNWKTLIQNKDAEIKRLNGIYQSILKNNNIDIFEGKASFVDQHTVEVNGKTITANQFLIAVGGWPYFPDIPGVKENAISSNEIFYLDDLPEKILIVGGGYIALEFASILKGLGSDVTVSYRRDLFLRGFDHDLRTRLKECMEQRGINLLFNSNVTKLSKHDDLITAEFEDGTNDQFDQVMYATGRKPKIDGLGLEKAGIDIDDHGAIKTNEHFQTSQAHIYAVGDVTDRVNLTPVAIQEGHFLADYLFNKQGFDMSYDNIATAVFTTPSMGTVGLTEEQAKERYNILDIYESSFRPMKNTLANREEKTYMKLIVDHQSDVVVGAHMIGPDSAEIIQMAGIPVSMKATKKQFDQTMAVHPTAAEEFVTMRSISRQEK